MPRIRKELFAFVDMWNTHDIRKQPNRPHVVPGQPIVLYEQLDRKDVQRFSVPLDRSRWQQIRDILDRDPIDLDAYLPFNTMLICDLIMQKTIGPDLPEEQEEAYKNFPWFREYNILRDHLRKWRNTPGVTPLSLLTSATGSLARLETFLEGQGVHIDQIAKSIESDEELAMEP
jgi:hypothetical protein